MANGEKNIETPPPPPLRATVATIVEAALKAQRITLLTHKPSQVKVQFRFVEELTIKNRATKS